jgi:hypothetical protein
LPSAVPFLDFSFTTMSRPKKLASFSRAFKAWSSLGFADCVARYRAGLEALRICANALVTLVLTQL